MNNTNTQKSKPKSIMIIAAVALLAVSLVSSLFLFNKTANASEVAPQTMEMVSVAPEASESKAMEEAVNTFISEREALTSLPSWMCVNTDTSVSFLTGTPNQEQFASYAISRTAVSGGGENVVFSTPECLMPIVVDFAADGSYTPDEAFMANLADRTAQVGFAGATDNPDKVYSVQPIIVSSDDVYPGVSLIADALVSENNAHPDSDTAALLKEHGQGDSEALSGLTVGQLDQMITALKKLN